MDHEEQSQKKRYRQPVPVMMTVDHWIGAQVRTARLKKGFSQAELSDKIVEEFNSYAFQCAPLMTQQRVSDIERGSPCKASEMWAISHILSANPLMFNFKHQQEKLKKKLQAE
jgi:transcriptional regulator with XRE-family HTH domain